MKNIAWISNLVRVLVFAGFGLLASSTSLLAQSSGPSFFVGPIVGHNGVAYNTNVFGPPNSLPGFENTQNGTGGTQFAGVSAMFPLSTRFNNFFVVEVIYDSKSAPFTQMTRGTSYQIWTISGESMSASLDYLLLNVGYKHNFFADSVMPSGLGVQLCASLGKTIRSKFTTVITDTENLSNGGSGPIQNGTSVTNIDGINAFRLAIRFDLTYDIPFFSRLILTPSVGFDKPITKVDNTSRNWWASSVYGAIALRYAIGSF